jgi:hypothetical protein
VAHRMALGGYGVICGRNFVKKAFSRSRLIPSPLALSPRGTSARSLTIRFRNQPRDAADACGKGDVGDQFLDLEDGRPQLLL